MKTAKDKKRETSSFLRLLIGHFGGSSRLLDGGWATFWEEKWDKSAGRKSPQEHKRAWERCEVDLLALEGSKQIKELLVLSLAKPLACPGQKQSDSNTR